MPEPGAFAAAMMRDKRAPKHSRYAKALRREGVRATSEFLRIKALPTRSLADCIDVVGLSAMLRLPDGDPNKCKGYVYDPITNGRVPCPYCVEGNATLRDDQAYALKEIHDVGSAYIAMRAGGGKAWITLLGPVLQRARRPLLMMPSGVVEQTLEDVIPIARRHWKLPEHIIVTSYESLSSQRGKTFLHERMPDCVHADEAHHLKTEDSARTLRFMRYFDDFPQVPLTIYTGTPQARSIKELAPLIRLALKGYSFLPDDDDELEQWCCAIDADVDDGERMGAGSLLEFAELMTPADRAACKSELELARRAFFERARLTPGVVYSTGDAPNIPIKFHEHKPVISDNLRAHFALLRDWKLDKGGGVIDEIADATHMYRAARQLAQGFFYRWIWPDNTPDLIWIEARKAWHQFVRRAIAFCSAPAYDSYGEVEKACARQERYALVKAIGDRATMNELKDLPRIDSHPYRNWIEAKPRYTPVKEVVWIDPFLVNEAAAWARANRGIIWCESEAFGQALASIGIPYYGGGDNGIRTETRSCAAAIKAHSFGKNLQRQFDANFLPTPSTNGKEFEQLIARTHRDGQTSPVVSVTISLHVRELWQGWTQAIRDAEFMSGVGVEQRLTMPLCDLSSIRTDNDRAAQLIDSENELWKYPARR
jgi:hypothetical protein